jgi:hypothetical protein
MRVLLILAAVMMALWLVGLGAGAKAGAAWGMFLLGIALFLAWLFMMKLSRPRRPLP